jgi:F0F1-type ATP synthase membrane subunit b/b'
MHMLLAVSAGGIVVLVVVVAVIVVLLAALIPRMNRARSERQLQTRRDEVAGRHRAEADARAQRADLAEAEARRARAEADVHAQEAELHERGLADDRLDGDPAGRFDRADDRSPAVERDPERG